MFLGCSQLPSPSKAQLGIKPKVRQKHFSMKWPLAARVLHWQHGHFHVHSDIVEATLFVTSNSFKPIPPFISKLQILEDEHREEMHTSCVLVQTPAGVALTGLANRAKQSFFRLAFAEPILINAMYITCKGVGLRSSKGIGCLMWNTC